MLQKGGGQQGTLASLPRPLPALESWLQRTSVLVVAKSVNLVHRLHMLHVIRVYIVCIIQIHVNDGDKHVIERKILIVLFPYLSVLACLYVLGA